MDSLENVVVFAGEGDKAYVDDVCTLLDVKRGEMEFRYFVDSDPYLRVHENVGGKDVFLVLRYHRNTMHNWAQILCFANAALNEGANSVNAFETYLGCSRQERKSRPGEAITLQVKVLSIMGAGIRNFSTFAVHSDATMLAFDPSRTRFTNFPLWPAMVRVLYNIVGEGNVYKIVGPDAGAAKPTREILNSTTVSEDDRFSSELSIVDKDRVHQESGTSKSSALIGDVNSAIATIFDDESITVTSVYDGAGICLKEGAKGVYVALAHPKFTKHAPGMEKMRKALGDGLIEKLIITNSCDIPQDIHGQLGIESDSSKLVVIPTQPLVAEYIRMSAAHKGTPYLFSSRGVLRPYIAIRNRTEMVETSERSPDYNDKFERALELYRRLAEPVLGRYNPSVRSHMKLVSTPGTNGA
jgi:ribose-phosphate pyrophosphokinase